MATFLDTVGMVAWIVVGVVGLDRIAHHKDSWIRLTSGALLLAVAMTVLGALR